MVTNVEIGKNMEVTNWLLDEGNELHPRASVTEIQRMYLNLYYLTET